MPEEIDIYRSANLLIDQHGEDAPIFAAMQADKCLASAAFGVDHDRRTGFTWGMRAFLG